MGEFSNYVENRDDAAALDGSELVVISQGGTAVKTTTSDIAALGGAGVSDGDKGDVVVSGSGAVWTVDSASEDAAGKVELATSAETITGTDTARAVTPAGLAAVIAPIRREVTSSSALVQTDHLGIVKFNSATPINFEIIQIADESAVQFINYGAGAVTFTNGSGVTTAGNLTLPGAVGTNYPMAALIVDAPTTPRIINGLILGSNLTTIEALVPAEGSFMQYKSGAWADRTPDQVRADLGYAIALSIHQSTSGLTLTDAPSAERILGGVTSPHRVRVDAASYQFAKLNTDVNTGSASANSPRVYIKYTTDLTGATGWTTVGTGVGAEVISLTSTGLKTTNWITLPGAARSDVLLAVYDAGGDGVADPIVNNVRIFLK